MQVERDGVSEAEVEAAARALYERAPAQRGEWPWYDTVQWDDLPARHRIGFFQAAQSALRAAIAFRPATLGGDAAGLDAEVANLQARLAASEAERGKMADTAVAGWLEHNKLRWDAEERATAAEARAEAAQAVLRRVEWVETSRGNFRCPCCRCSYLNVNCVTYSHTSDCDLAAALAVPQPSDAENDRLRARLGDAPVGPIPSNAEHDHHG